MVPVWCESDVFGFHLLLFHVRFASPNTFILFLARPYILLSTELNEFKTHWLKEEEKTKKKYINTRRENNERRKKTTLEPSMRDENNILWGIKMRRADEWRKYQRNYRKMYMIFVVVVIFFFFLLNRKSCCSTTISSPCSGFLVRFISFSHSPYPSYSWLDDI